MNRLATALLCALLGAVHGCGSVDGGGVAVALPGSTGLEEPEPEDELERPIIPTDGFLERQAEYLAACSDASGPGSNAIYGQVCRLLTGQSTFDQDTIDAACAKVDAREDTADFRVAGLVRLLYLHELYGGLPEAIHTQIETTLLDFRYWLREPGDDKMCFWTENHQILFHSGELLIGQLYPDAVFSNSGMTGAEHVEHATPLLLRWLELRGRHGFSEWHSNVYFNEDIPALINLVDFAQDEAIHTMAAMVLDTIALDLLHNMYDGAFATTHGRTYSNKFLDGLKDSTSEFAHIALGLGDAPSPTNFSGAFLATSPAYWPPAILESYAHHVAPTHEHKQHDSFDVTEGPAYGVGYAETDDVVVWAGLAALVAPEVIDGTATMLTEHDLWNGFLFGDIPEPYNGMLKDLAGTPGLQEIAWELEAVARGIALEGVDTYTYRTPHYQLSGAQNYKPGTWSSQTQTWLATLDKEAYVFTSFPGNSEALGLGLQFGGEWIGGWAPMATFHENVGVIQYRLPEEDLPLVGQYLTGPYLHAYFPKSRFDEVIEAPPWVFGRKGDGYVALASEHPTSWSEEHDYELIADTLENVWVVELGNVDEWGDFDGFVAAVGAAELTFDDDGVDYASPSQGTVIAKWEGSFLVDGAIIDLGPYERWDSPGTVHERGEALTVVEHAGERLELDFELAERRYR